MGYYTKDEIGRGSRCVSSALDGIGSLDDAILGVHSYKA